MNNEREGADITAAHMVDPATEPSNITNFFAGATIFITGSTGFIGKLLVEKLLRSCKRLKKIYVLLREKEGQTCELRLSKYFDNPLYERLKREHYEALNKLVLIKGDCSLPYLGLNEFDKQLLKREVNCIFHCAQNGENLQSATFVNVRSTRDLLKLANEMDNLRSFVFLSSAFSYFPLKIIEETFYKPKITINRLLGMAEILDLNMLEAVTQILIEGWPNSFLFTKSIAEEVIKDYGPSLPVVIVRPSIVVGTAKEPVAGWSDKFYGLVGLYCGISLGIIHTFKYELNTVIDQVPADYVVNCMLAASWQIGITKGLNINKEVCDPLENEYWSIPIYNYVSSSQKPLTLRENVELGQRFAELNPSVLQIWHSFILPTNNKYTHRLLHVIFNNVLFYVAKFYIYVARHHLQWPVVLEIFKKIELATKSVEKYLDRQWTFRNNKVQTLWAEMNSEDQKIFEFNIATLDTDLYYNTLIRGGRVYILNDPVDTVPKALKIRQTLNLLHHVLIAFLLFIPTKLILNII